MKQVDVYEVSKTVRTLAGNYDEIPMVELVGPNGRAWGNPHGGDAFIRYSAPVTRVNDSWVEDGYTHRRDYYVAIAPRLLELLAPAVNEGLARVNATKSREIEDLLMARRGLDKVCADRWKQIEGLVEVVNDHVSRERNFREANVLTRIWRAIRRDI